MLKDVTDLLVTADMHERKKLMFEKSDAFVALPGGIGTLEELVEQLTWSQLGQRPGSRSSSPTSKASGRLSSSYWTTCARLSSSATAWK